MEQILESIADSLKRIADHFDPETATAREEFAKKIEDGTVTPEIDDSDPWE